MIRKSIILMAIGLFWSTLFAQNNMPTALDQLAIQCQEVIALNDTINARKDRLNVLKKQLDVLTQNWWNTCNEALSSSACDDNDTRISTLNELIRLTDKNYEKDLYVQLMEAKNNPKIRSLTPVDQTPTGNGRGNANQRKTSPKVTTHPSEESTTPVENRGDDADAKNSKKVTEDIVVNPIKEDQPKEDQSKGKDETSTSPTSKDSKKDNTGKEGGSDKKDETGKDKTKIESKDQTNRNKTIDIFNKNKNQNK